MLSSLVLVFLVALSLVLLLLLLVSFAVDKGIISKTNDRRLAHMAWQIVNFFFVCFTIIPTHTHTQTHIHDKDETNIDRNSATDNDFRDWNRWIFYINISLMVNGNTCEHESDDVFVSVWNFYVVLSVVALVLAVFVQCVYAGTVPNG